MSSSTIVTVVIFSLLGLFILALALWTIRSRRQEEEGLNLPVGQPRWESRPPGQSYPSSTQGSTPAGPSTLMGKILQNISPDLTGLMDISAYVKDQEEKRGRPLTREEKEEAVKQAVSELLEQHPENTLLRQMRVSLVGNGITGSEELPSNNIRVRRIGTTTTVIVDGVSYSGMEEIPDPAVREQARKMLDAMDNTAG